MTGPQVFGQELVYQVKNRVAQRSRVSRPASNLFKLAVLLLMKLVRYGHDHRDFLSNFNEYEYRLGSWQRKYISAELN